MDQYITYVVRMPEDPDERRVVEQALQVLRPHATAMSLEDEMTVLDFIEEHPDFSEHIAEDARKRAKEVAHTMHEQEHKET